LALVEEEDGMVFVVEDAEGFVRVVCPIAQSEINERTATDIKIARMIYSLVGKRFPVTIPFDQ
jgi:hypothetical protein